MLFSFLSIKSHMENINMNFVHFFSREFKGDSVCASFHASRGSILSRS